MSSSDAPIRRMTLFKIPKEEDRQHLLGIYKTMKQDALKDGKPYIHSCYAGETFDDHRRQGFTLAVFTTFASEADMKYYDDDCEAHKQLKAFAKNVHEGVMMVYFKSVVDN